MAYRTEIHIIRKNHRLFKYCDDMCFKSKNLYNRANYLMRQYSQDGKSPFWGDVVKQMRRDKEECFTAMPIKTSQIIILQLGYNWKSFFKSIRRWNKDKTGYTGKPNLPKFKKKDGRNAVYFDYQQGSFRGDKYYFGKRRGDDYDNYIETKINKKSFVRLTIVPQGSCYKIAIIYKVEIPDKTDYNDKWLAIDLGINNLATLTNNIGTQPIVINGRILKSVNNFYNKEFARFSSYIGRGTSNRIKTLVFKHKKILNDHLHKVSRKIVNFCIENEIENIAIGFNKDWQRNVNLGKKNNQKFSQIPFTKLVEKIQYKAEQEGIRVYLVPEQYTSKASFLDSDPLDGSILSGKRKSRGLYYSANGTSINADVNGSYNILRKCNPEGLCPDRIKGIALYPVRVSV